MTLEAENRLTSTLTFVRFMKFQCMIMNGYPSAQLLTKFETSHVPVEMYHFARAL